MNKPNENKHTDTENRTMVTRREGEWGEVEMGKGVNWMETKHLVVGTL